MPNAINRGAPKQTHAAAPTIGTKFQHTGKPSPYKQVTAKFDGKNLVMYGDGKEIGRASGQSGRPYDVKPGDAQKYGAPAEGETYLNNPKYQKSKDNGPLPEGKYTFKADQMMFFSKNEATNLILNNATDPFGKPMHMGDWGTGRVALTPEKGTNTFGRAGFYMHGGVAPGSSGCIDVGNAMMDKMKELLDGYKGPVTIEVKYTEPAPSVGWVSKAVTRAMYPGKDASITNRAKRFWGGGTGED